MTKTTKTHLIAKAKTARTVAAFKTIAFTNVYTGCGIAVTPDRATSDKASVTCHNCIDSRLW